MNLEINLQQLGLSEKEASLYLAGLQTGPATLQQLVNASKLKRATTYDVITSLKEKGLFKTVVYGKRKKYLAETPNNLFSLLKQKETVLKTIIGNLLVLQNTAGDKPSVKIYQGIGGVKEIYEDMLSRKNDTLEVLSTKLPDQRLIDYWGNEYIKRRIKRGSFARLIAPDVPFYRKLQSTDKHSLREVRLVPADTVPFKNEVMVYGNKVSFVTQNGDDSLGLIIESNDISETLRLVVEKLWSTLPSVNRLQENS